MTSPGTDLMLNSEDLLDDRPRNSWLQQINNGSLTSIRQSQRAAGDRAHCGSSLRASAAYNDDDDLPRDAALYYAVCATALSVHLSQAGVLSD